MRKNVVRYLRCPHCAAPLRSSDRTLRCENGHTFDVARQGYVNLLRRPTKLAADTTDMVAARAALLDSGHYAPLTERLAGTARRAAGAGAPDCVVDIGGGTGHHLARVLEEFEDAEGLLLDMSKPAVRRAARAHPRASSAVADVWDTLPLRDGAAAMALNVFAPRNPPEIRRILRPGGTLLVVTPQQDHLAELVDALGLLRVRDHKEGRLAEQLAPHFEAVGQERLRTTLRLDHDALGRVVAMGPSSWHQDPDELARRIAELPGIHEVTLSVTFTVCRPLP
ncbi:MULTISPECIES: 23S rRNA (guanine(748)-N(1))-methyltransferase Erm(32) [Streptomyces]|uniref:23S rRNA (guanine(748)-N(1))-methyltransferase n=3 Tax=Streptomyces TaxID=1883 RepID=RLMA2_STRFR|nr:MULTISPECIES: 23S rRNA (guanine(748)-N(1))-methyltransferase Erm(32) [Streptomyces]Q9S1M6.1 RecName: Full=23S rRNA (guanine(748)-N(1))-methyltransferase; AltName: Full=23S rRNA m1G748 methyltransferase; AltName: Full=Tylosin-resistance methyltransferase RlmA(II) [Streptomyces fradiae]KNE79459.1 23S rRNA methyltransferase [Streptomyces fradiae]OFA40113.1 hypothetical protein BEN35_26015 [Streptomyces fradiae]PQM19487.1 23S rRNA (guanine(748)-N(1))-methyltransferase Erm(32) [Streptomyces xingh